MKPIWEVGVESDRHDLIKNGLGVVILCFNRCYTPQTLTQCSLIRRNQKAVKERG
jgi:hypothetical protein